MDDKLEIHCQDTSEVKINKFGLPLVSVIIINYNYGRFLKQAAESVFEQTYPNIECIIVDNASTDCSAGVLLDISREYPDAKILRRKDPGGQSLASKEGFEASLGEYVIFVDADDYLLASCVETHVFVHLSLRVPVGFSSSDMIQAVNSRMVLGTVAYLSEYVRSGRGKSPGLLRRIDKSAPGVRPLPSPDASNFYLREEHLELRHAFRLPPNIHDRFANWPEVTNLSELLRRDET